MFGLEIIKPVSELNWVLLLSCGIWFSLVCLIKMVETAWRLNRHHE